jgi:hypothetical protein
LHEEHHVTPILKPEERGNFVAAQRVCQLVVGRGGIAVQLAAIADDEAFWRGAQGHIINAQDTGNNGGEDFSIGEHKRIFDCRLLIVD